MHKKSRISQHQRENIYLWFLVFSGDINWEYWPEMG